MNIPTLDLLKLTKEPTNQLKNLLPYSFIISPGVCLLKNAAVMATYQVEYPDLESSAAGDIAGGLIGQLFAKRNLKLQEESNKRIAKFNQQLEYENQRNAGLLQMQGLKNAGMNVGAMLGGTPQVASAPADGS